MTTDTATSPIVALSRRPRPRSVPASATGHLIAILLVILLTQRLAVPLGEAGQLPVTVPLCLAVVAHGLSTNQLRLDRVRVSLFVIAMAGLVAVTVIAGVNRQSPSAMSLLMVAAIYLLLLVEAPKLTTREFNRVLDVFVVVMRWSSVLGLLQLAVQYAGVPGGDWLAPVVPADFLVQGYNSGDPLEYGSPIIRVNGLIFLEPSFLSFFLGLAAVVALWRGKGVLTVSLLLLGIIPTSAGNGVVVFGLGLAAISLSSRRGRLRMLVVPMAATLALAVATPFGNRFVSRTAEFGQSDASANLRIVEPYVRFFDLWLENAQAMVWGYGAGNSSGILNASQTDGLLTPILPKLVLEYGLFATVGFLLFLMWALFAGHGHGPWTAGLLISYAVVNAAFLQPTMALTTVVFVHLLRLPRQSGAQSGAQPLIDVKIIDVRERDLR